MTYIYIMPLFRGLINSSTVLSIMAIIIIIISLRPPPPRVASYCITTQSQIRSRFTSRAIGLATAKRSVLNCHLFHCTHIIAIMNIIMSMKYEMLSNSVHCGQCCEEIKFFCFLFL